MVKEYDEEGKPRPLDPGEVAAVDQAAASFRTLLRDLTDIHARARVIVLGLGQSEQSWTEMAQVQADLHKALGDEFETDGGFDPGNAYSFIMYLINELTMMHARDVKIADLLNSVGAHINVVLAQMGTAADLLGMGETFTMEVTPEVTGETFTSGIGQKLFNVHRRDDCVGWCVVHKPLPGPWKDWPTVWRGDGPMDIWRGFERRCPCGVGHTAMEELLRANGHPHGCCGVCPCGPPVAEPIFGADGMLEGYR